METALTNERFDLSQVPSPFLAEELAESSNRLLEGNYVRWWRRRSDLPKPNSVLFPNGLVIMLEKHCWPAMAKCQA